MSVLGEHQITHLAKDIFEVIDHGTNMPQRIMGGGDGQYDTFAKFADKGIPPGLFYIQTKRVTSYSPSDDEINVVDEKMFSHLFESVMHGSSRKKAKQVTKKRRSKA